MPLFNNGLLPNVDSHPGFKPGNYYLHTPNCSTTTNSTNVLVANSLIYTPVFVPRRATIDRLGIRTIAAIAGSLSRIGIYNNSLEGLPSSLLFDAGELDTSSVNFKECIVNRSLDIGWYWLAANCNVAPNLQISNTYFGSLYYLGFSGPLASANSYCYQQPSVSYGALPTVAPVTALINKSNFPLFWFRVA